ncbi:hypothetical protein AAMO2058_000134500, partial [Amorphochlora amoebiformis]
PIRFTTSPQFAPPIFPTKSTKPQRSKQIDPASPNNAQYSPTPLSPTARSADPDEPNSEEFDWFLQMYCDLR